MSERELLTRMSSISQELLFSEKDILELLTYLLLREAVRNVLYYKRETLMSHFKQEVDLKNEFLV